jgi:hypothetical protein
MGPIQRFTRDGVSRYVWGGMSLVAIIGLVYALTAGAQALDRTRTISEERAVRLVDRVLAPKVDDLDLTEPIVGASADSLEAYVGLLILTDPRVERVRVWSSTDKGMLLFSTGRKDPIDIGSRASLNDPFLIAAVREGPISPSGLSDTGIGPSSERSLFRTYAPLGGDAVAEIDQTDEGTIAPVRTRWLSYQILAGVLVLLFLFMSALSLRDPIQQINVGVASAASIPAGFSLIDNDRLHSVREVYRLATERVKRLQEKLSESEEARRRLEGDIQRALALAESSVTRPAAPASVVPSATQPAPEPTIVQVPESDVVADEPGDVQVAASTGPLHAPREQQPFPPTPPKETPAGEEPRRASKQKKAKQEKAKQETPAAASSTRNTPDPETRDAKAHAAALETFVQLTEKDRQPQDAADQGAVRALSPAAARKKLLAERLKPPPQEESAGDPRTGTD